LLLNSGSIANTKGDGCKGKIAYVTIVIALLIASFSLLTFVSVSADQSPDQSTLRFLESAQGNPNFTLSRTKNITAPINPQPIISSAKVILSSIYFYLPKNLFAINVPSCEEVNNIDIINAQSYPTVEGNWTVRFNTTGQANLTITPVNNTYFGVDIQFLELRCGDNTVQPAYNKNSVLYPDWNCSVEAEATFKVLSPGKHALEFRFDDDVDYAYNQVAYYVDGENPICSDDNAGSEASPWCTIQKAADTMKAEDTVYVKAGTYDESVVIETDGTSGKPITYHAYPGDEVIVNATGFNYGFSLDHADYIVIDGFKITGANKDAIYLDHSNHNIITNNTAYNNARGIYLDKSINNSLTLHNLSNNDYGIYLDHSINTTIKGNIINNNTHGIGIDGDNNQILENDILNNSASEASGIHLTASASGNVIHFNNIVGNSPAGSGSYGVYNDNTAETVNATYNYWGDPAGPGGVGPGSGDNVSANVTYRPWLVASYPATETISRGISMFPTPTTKTVDADTDANYTITIENTGNAPDTFTLNVTSNADNATLTSDSVQIGAGSSLDVILCVKDPDSGTYITTIKATSTDDTSKKASATVTTRVSTEDVYGVSISSTVTSKSVEKNENATYMLTITNAGNKNDTFDISVCSDCAVCCCCNASECCLTCGESTDVCLNVRGSRIGEDYLTRVTARSQNDTTKEDTISIRTTIIRALDLKVDASTRSVNTTENATYILTLKNTGNQQHTYTLTKSGSGAGKGELNVSTINNLGVGESSQIRLNVSSETEGFYVVTVTANTTTAGGVKDEASITTTTTVSQAPVYGISLTVDKNSQTVNKNIDATYTITIQNTGNQPDTYNLTVVNTRADSAILTGATTETLNAGASATRTLNVKDSTSGTYDVKVIAVSQEEPSKQDSITTSTLVKGYGVLIIADTQSQTKKVGSSATTYTLTIKNTGNTVDSYALSVTKNSDTASLSSSGITNLAAGATDTVTLTVINSAEGTYYANVTATSDGDNSKADNVNVSTTFTPIAIDRYGLELSVSPSTKNVEIDEDAFYILTVKNTGNVPDTFDLTKSGEGSLSTSSLTLSTGETGSTTLTVSGASITTYTTTITATSQKDPSKTSTVSTFTTVVRAASLTVTPASQAVYLGNASKFTLTIKNTGTAPHTYNVSIDEYTSETAELDVKDIYLTSGSSADVILTMNASSPGTYTAEVTATVSGTSKSESITVRALYYPAAPVYGVQLVVNTEEQAIKRGKYALYLLTIRNIGNQKDTFTLTKTTDETGSAVLSPLSITLNASGTTGDTATATLNVTNTTAGEYRVNVEACSNSDTSAKDSVKTTTRVIGASGNTITDSELDESSTITNSTIIRSTVVRSTINSSTITDSEITDSTMHNSTVTDTVLEDVTLENADVRSGTIYSGKITIEGITYEISEEIAISDIMVSSDEEDSSIAGSGGDTTHVTLGTHTAKFTIGNNRSYVGGSLKAQESSVWTEGTIRLSLGTGEYINIDASDNIEEGMSWVMINVTYDDSGMSSMEKRRLRLNWYNETSGEWVRLVSAGNPPCCYGAGVNTDENYVWANVSHFSDYGMQAPEVPDKHLGGVGVSVLPKIQEGEANKSYNFTIRITNTQNFDEIVDLEATLSDIPEGYRANLSWLNWTADSIVISKDSSSDIGLRMDISAEVSSGYKCFSIHAEATVGVTKDYGVVNVTG